MGRQLGARCARLAEPGHGRWYVAVQVTGADGRRVRVRRGGFDTQAQAQREGRRLQNMSGVEAGARRWTVERWLQGWLSRCAMRLRRTTMVNYRRIAEKFLIPRLGAKSLTALGVRDVQRALDSIARSRVRSGGLIASSTVDRVRAVLRSALSDARRHGLIGKNC